MSKKIEPKVTNGASSGCYRVPEHVANYLQSQYFRTNGQFSLNSLIGLALSSDGEHPSLIEDSESQYYLEGAFEIIESIESKMKKGEEISSVDEEFLASLAETLRRVRRDSHLQDNTEKKISLSAAECLQIIRESLPTGDREDVIDQLFSAFQREMDKCEDQNPELSRLEAFTYYQNKIFQIVREGTIRSCKTWLQVLGSETPPQGFPVKKFKSYAGKTALFESLIKTCEDDKSWASLIFALKERFFLAEKIKVGEIGHVETINLEEDNEMSNTEVETAEETGKEHWQVKVDSQSAFGSLSREVRSILYRTQDSENTKYGFLGFYPTANVMQLHKTLMGTRSQSLASTSEEFIDKLPVNVKVSIKRAIERDPTLQTAIFRVYNKGEQDYGYYTFKSDGNFYYEASYKSRSSFAAYQEYQATYYQLPRHATQDDRDYHVFDHEGRIIKAKAQVFSNWIQNCTYEYDATNDTYVFKNKNYQDENNEKYSCHRETKDHLSPGRREVINRISSSLGLKFTEEEKRRFAENDDAFISLLINSKRIAVTFKKNLSIKEIFKDTNKNFWRIFQYAKPLATVSKANMVDKKQRRKELGFEDSFRYNKSTYYPHIVKNYIMDLFEDIKRGISEYNKLKYLMNNPVMEHNFLAKEAKSKSSIAKTLASSLTRLLGDKETAFENFKEADNLRMLLADNLTHFTLTDSSQRYVRVPLFITGDSNADRVFLLPMLKQEEINDKLMDVLESEILRMEQFQAFEATIEERSRLAKISPDSSLSWGNVHDNSDKFTFLTFLNENTEQNTALRDSLLNILYPMSSAEALDQRGQLENKTIAEILFAYYREHPKEFSETLKEQRIQELFVGETGVITQFFNSQYKEFHQTLVDCGLIQKEGTSTALPLLNRVTSEYRSETEDKQQDKPGEEYLQSLYLNLKYYNIQQLQFLTGDVGFYDNVENLQKRFKQMIASGDPIDITAKFPDGSYVWQKAEDVKKGKIKEDITQNVVYVQQQKVSIQKLLNPDEDPNSPYRKLYDVKGDGKKETKASLTDGQAWRSFTSYRKIMAGLSKWTANHERVYQIILKHREDNREAYERGEIVPLTKAELNEILETGVIFQPLKPYYFGFDMVEYKDMEQNPRSMPVPVQHKYSEFPLIPELLPIKNSSDGSINKLAAMGIAMELDGIDLICDSTCVKVGCFGEVNIDNCNDVASFRQTFMPREPKNPNDPNSTETVRSTKLIHSLPLHNWREQSNQPAHNDVVRALGTQLTYHAYANLEGMKPTHYPSIERLFPKNEQNRRVIKLTENEELDITDGFNKETMVKLLNFLLGTGYVKAAAKLNSDYSTLEKVGKELTEIALRDDRVGFDKVLGYGLNEDNDFLVPINEATNAWDNCAAILSQIRKKVVKRGMKGGSAIQVSPYGFDDVLQVHVDENNNMVVSDCAMVFDITVKGPNGEPVELNYTDYVDNVTGMMLGYEVDLEGKLGNTLKPVEPAEPEIDKATGQFVKGREFYGWNTKLGMHYGDILSLIAYRIPTEKEYSVLKLQVKRFFPKTSGGIIMVPSIFTQVAGFDFDIDKLFFIRKTFGFGVKEGVTNKDIWDGIYTQLENNASTKPLYDRMVALREQARLLDVGDDVELAAQTINDEIQRIETALDNLNAFPKEIRESKTIEDLFSKMETVEKTVDYTDKEGNPQKMKIRAFALPGRKRGLLENLEARKAYIEKVQEELKEHLKELLQEKVTLYNNIEDAYRGEKLRDYYEMARHELFNSPTVSPQIKEAIGELPSKQSDLFRQYFQQNIQKYGEDSIVMDPSKPLFNQSQAVVNNLFFQILSERLSSPDTLNERTTPGGPWMHKKVKPLMMSIRYGLAKLTEQELKDMASATSTETALKKYSEKFEDYSPSYDATDPLTIVHYQTYNALYDRLIGIAANQNINQRLTAICQEYILAEGNLSFGSMLGSSDDNMGRNIQATMIEGRDTELIVTEFLSGAVDAVKDALLEFFGISDDNFNVVCCLAKLGASAEDLGLLFNQPIVMQALKIMQKKKRIGLQSALNEAINTLEKEYKGKLREGIENVNKQNKVKYDQSDVTTENLCKSLVRGEIYRRESLDSQATTSDSEEDLSTEEQTVLERDRLQFFRTQLAVVHLLEAAQGPATELSEQINVTKTTSVKTLGSTPGSILALIDRQISFAKSLAKSAFRINTSVGSTDVTIPIDPTSSVSDRESGKKIVERNLGNAFGLAAIAYASIKGTWDNIICKLFPYSRFGYKALKNTLTMLTNKDYISEEAYDDIIRDGTLFFCTKLFPVFEEIENVKILDAANNEVATGLKSPDFYINHFPAYYYGLVKYFEKNPEFQSIPLLQCIEIEGGLKVNKKAKLVFKQISGSEKLQRDTITESWNMMVHSEDPKIRALANHLIRYSFYMSGFSYSTSSFLHTLSTEVKTLYTGNDQFSPSEGEITYANMFNALFGVGIQERVSAITGRNVDFITTVNGQIDRQVPVKLWQKLFLKHNARKYYQFSTTLYPGSDIYKALHLETSPASFTVDMTKEVIGKHREMFIIKTEYQDEEEVIPTKYYFKPCIVVGDNLYICDNSEDQTSGDPEFNSTTNTEAATMTYYLVSSGIQDGKNYNSLDNVAVLSEQEKDFNDTIKELIEVGQSETIDTTESKEVITTAVAWKRLQECANVLSQVIKDSGPSTRGEVTLSPHALELLDQLKTFMHTVRSHLSAEDFRNTYDECMRLQQTGQLQSKLLSSPLSSIPNFTQACLEFTTMIKMLAETVGREYLGITDSIDLKKTMGLTPQENSRQYKLDHDINFFNLAEGDQVQLLGTGAIGTIIAKDSGDVIIKFETSVLTTHEYDKLAKIVHSSTIANNIQAEVQEAEQQQNLCSGSNNS